MSQNILTIFAYCFFEITLSFFIFFLPEKRHPPIDITSRTFWIKLNGFSKKVEGLAAKAKHDSHLQARIYDLDPPDLPSHLSPGQAAQLSELMEYIHIRIRELINSVQSDRKGESIDLDFEKWQDLLELQSRIAEYMRKIGQPE